MFTHVNLILSERMADKPQFLYDLAFAANVKLGVHHPRAFVRAIYVGASGSEHLANLRVYGLEYQHADRVRNLLTQVLNDFFIEDDSFLHYSFALGNRILASK